MANHRARSRGTALCTALVAIVARAPDHDEHFLPTILLIGPGAAPHLSCDVIALPAERIGLGTCSGLALDEFDAEFSKNAQHALNNAVLAVSKALGPPGAVDLIISCSRGASIVAEAARVLEMNTSVLMLSPILNGGDFMLPDDYVQLLAIFAKSLIPLTIAAGDSADEEMVITDEVSRALGELGLPEGGPELLIAKGDHGWYLDTTELDEVLSRARDKLLATRSNVDRSCRLAPPPLPSLAGELLQ